MSSASSKLHYLIFLACALVICTIACGLTIANAKPTSKLLETKMLFEWQEQTLSSIQKYQLSPLRAARVLAHVHSGIYETRNAYRRYRHANADSGTPDECTAAAISLFAGHVLGYFFPQETEGRFIARAKLRYPSTSVTCSHK